MLKSNLGLAQTLKINILINHQNGIEIHNFYQSLLYIYIKHLCMVFQKRNLMFFNILNFDLFIYPKSKFLIFFQIFAVFSDLRTKKSPKKSKP